MIKDTNLSLFYNVWSKFSDNATEIERRIVMIIIKKSKNIMSEYWYERIIFHLNQQYYGSCKKFSDRLKPDRKTFIVTVKGSINYFVTL